MASKLWFCLGLMALCASILQPKRAYAAEPPLSLDLTHGIEIPWDVVDLYPGADTGWVTLTIQNTGSIPAALYFYLTNYSGSAGGRLGEHLYLEIRQAGTGTGTAACEAPDAIVLFEQTIENLVETDNRIRLNAGAAEDFLPDEYLTLCERAYLPPESDNTTQDLLLQFDQRFFAENTTAQVAGATDSSKSGQGGSAGRVLGASIAKAGSEGAVAIGAVGICCLSYALYLFRKRL